MKTQAARPGDEGTLETQQAVVEQPAQAALTPRALLLALLFGSVGCWWVVQTSVIHYSAHVGGSVPPIPAITALLLLGLISPLLRRRGLSRGEMLVIYIVVSIAVVVPDPNSLLIYLIAFITAPHYFNQPERGFTPIAEALPAWFAPKDNAALRRFYDLQGGPRPPEWELWIGPLLGWGLFLCALWVTTCAVLWLFRERWLHHDRLRFPIVDLVMDITPERGRMPPFLRDRVMWLGFGLAAAHNLLNIGQAFNPYVPAAGRYVDIGAMLVQPPWDSLKPLWLSLRPEIFGIGYLMSTDVLFTAWLGYALLRLSNVARTAVGYEVTSTYYDYQEIAAGAYLGILLSLVWLARRPLMGALRGAWGMLARRREQTESDRVAGRAVLAAAGGFAYMVGWSALAGMGWWVAVLYFGIIVGFALVYARIRAETGAPLMFLFPFWQQQKLLINSLGGAALGASGAATLPVLATLGFLSRGAFPQYAAFQLEAMEIGERARIRSRHITAAVLLALPLGLIVGSYLVLTAAYHHGFNLLDGGTTSTGYRIYLAQQQFREVAQWQGRQAAPDIGLILQTLLGLGLTFGLSLLRSAWLGSPLHPLGFAMAASYGFHLWAPFFAVWVCKLLILKAGGMKLYRRLIPFFLGIVLGHYMVTGILWGILSLFAPALTHQFVVHFA
jgi:hypothetical protein